MLMASQRELLETNKQSTKYKGFTPLGRGVERQFFGAYIGTAFKSPRGRRNMFSSQARAGPIGNIESPGPVGG